MLPDILKNVYNSDYLWEKNVHPVVIVATDVEEDIIKNVLGDEVSVVQTGAGMVHAFEAIRNLPHKTPVLNFGYVGSNKLKIGEIVCVKHSWLYHPTVTIDKPDTTYGLKLVPNLKAVDCYTSSDFVAKADIEDAVVFDMELAAICTRFKNVVSVKIVSDNLSLDNYENAISKTS